MEISGKITRLLEIRNGVSMSTGKTWESQSFILESLEGHPRHICFEVFGEDKIKELNIQMGEVLTVSVEIESRQYQGRWYTQVRAWKVERQGQACVSSVITPQSPDMTFQQTSFAENPLAPNETIDVPF